MFLIVETCQHLEDAAARGRPADELLNHTHLPRKAISDREYGFVFRILVSVRHSVGGYCSGALRASGFDLQEPLWMCRPVKRITPWIGRVAFEDERA